MTFHEWMDIVVKAFEIAGVTVLAIGSVHPSPMGAPGATPRACNRSQATRFQARVCNV